MIIITKIDIYTYCSNKNNVNNIIITNLRIYFYCTYSIHINTNAALTQTDQINFDCRYYSY